MPVCPTCYQPFKRLGSHFALSPACAHQSGDSFVADTGADAPPLEHQAVAPSWRALQNDERSDLMNDHDFPIVNDACNINSVIEEVLRADDEESILRDAEDYLSINADVTPAFVPDSRYTADDSERISRRQHILDTAVTAGDLSELDSDSVCNDDESDTDFLFGNDPIVSPAYDNGSTGDRVDYGSGDQGNSVEDSSSHLRKFPRSGELIGKVDLSSPSVFNTQPDNIEVSTYDPECLQDHTNFHFRLALAKMISDLNPRPPNGFIDKLLDLLKYYSCCENPVDLKQKPMRNKTFIQQLRTLSGRTAKPVVAHVSLESGTYETLDQYEERNEYREKATVVYWNAYDQVRSIHGSKALFGKMENLVVNQGGEHGDPFDKYIAPDGRLSEVLSGDWYNRTYASIAAKHEARTDLLEKFPPFPAPLIGCIDAAGIDAYNRIKSEPFSITSLLLAENLRNKTSLSWRPLGLMPPLDHKSKNARLREVLGGRLSKALKSGLNARNYHRCLQRILQSLIDLQERGLVMRLNLGGVEKIVHVYFPMAMILGDIKSQDMLGCRVASHFFGCTRLCWQCPCLFHQIDDEEHHCKPFPVQEYREMVKNCEDITVYNEETDQFFGGSSTPEMRQEFRQRIANQTLQDVIDTDEEPWGAEPIMTLERLEQYIENLKYKGFYRVDSVMNQIDFGDSPYGQFAALGIDVLHSLLGGIIKQVVGCFIRGLPSATKELFEKVADRIFLLQRSCEDQFFPRMNFTHGHTNLTELTCREWAGLMMTILVVCKSYTGGAVLERLAKRTNRQIAKSAAASAKATENDERVSDCGSDNDSLFRGTRAGIAIGEDEILDPVTASDFIHVAEMVLSFYGYMNRKVFWERSNSTSAEYFQQSCDILMKTMKTKCPRLVGNGWSLSKVHAMLFRSKDHITEFGSPRHSNCEVVERMIKHMAKAPCGNTNRQNHEAVTKTAAANIDIAFLYHELDAIIYGDVDIDTNNDNLDGEGVCNGPFESLQSPESLTQYVPRKAEWIALDAEKVCCRLTGSPSYQIGYHRIVDPTTKKSSVIFEGKWSKHRALGVMECPQIVRNHMHQHFFAGKANARTMFIDCHTETFLKTGKRVRCHPNFRSNGQRFDWVLLREDPFQGINCMFQGYDGSHNVPVPEAWEGKAALDENGKAIFWDDDEEVVLHPVADKLMGRIGESIGISVTDGAAQCDDIYFANAWRSVAKDIHSLLNYTGKRARKDFLESELEDDDIQRMATAPGHFYVADLPLPSQKEFLLDDQRRFGRKVVPAKVLCLFQDPETSRTKALVHPCCHRTNENFVQSSSLLTNWSLQYMYAEQDHDGTDDMLCAQTAIVDVEYDIVDRICVKQEFPGYNDFLNPSDWKVHAGYFGLKPVSVGRTKKKAGDIKGLEMISTFHNKNRLNRRRASDAKRSVYVIQPMEYWGHEFTTEAPTDSAESRVGGKKRKERN